MWKDATHSFSDTFFSFTNIYFIMGKQKKTRKFSVAKKVINPKDPRMYVFNKNKVVCIKLRELTPHCHVLGLVCLYQCVLILTELYNELFSH